MELKRIVLDGTTATVAVLGDLHEGSANHREDALNATIATIRKNGWYYILMGDLIDCIIATDPRFNPLEISRKYKINDLKDLPRKQADHVIAKFKGIEDKCIAILCGNHEESYAIRHSFNVYNYMASHFPKAVQLGYLGIIRLVLEKSKHSASWDIVCNHGAGSPGNSAGSPKNTLATLSKFYDCDVFLAGHLHRLEVGTESFMYPNERMTAINYRVKWFGQSGCYLSTYEPGQHNYFEKNGKAPSDIGYLKMTLDMGEQKKGVWQKNTRLETVFEGGEGLPNYSGGK